jgi:serine protease Do
MIIPSRRSSARAGGLLPQALTLVLAAFPAVSLISISPVRAADTDAFQMSGDEAGSIFDKAKAAVVQVRSGDKGYVLAGSGFFIDDQGTVLTSSTVLGDNKRARVLINGVEMDAKIIGNDPRSGLAMLRVSYDESPCLPMAHAGDLKTGDGVVLIGYPMNLAVASSQGPVSGFEASYLAKIQDTPSVKDSVSAVERFATTHIHANVSISPGQVGGPLLNARGEVVGLVATSPDDGKTIYALPVDAIGKIIADFNLYGRARHGWVGVNVTMGTDTDHDGRLVRVVQVMPGTPASQSGIQAGDTVMRIDSREIYRPADVLDASFFSHVGGTMIVVIRRDEKLYDYSFAVIERPGSPAAATTPTTPVTGAPMLSSEPAPSSGQPVLVNHVVNETK